eukprot:scaffold4097_cov166-Amphora_coffeaeformis.AAC.1
MMKLLLSLISLSAVNAATKIAVIEAGVGGTVHRTTSTTPQTSVDGAVSFMQAMHGRKIQHAGMTVVPDLFKRADSGVVIGVSGSAVDFAEMPLVAGIFDEDTNGVIGQMEIQGGSSNAIMSKVGGWKEVEDVSGASEEAQKAGLSGVKLSIDESNVSAFDSSIHGLIVDIDTQAKKDGKTVIIYLVVEEDAAVARRRTLASRRLEEEEVNQYNNANQGNNAGGDKAGFYGYGYFNDYGEWVTPYKTMFQIQYFNVVLWTAVGLTIVLFSTIYLMMFMPMEPDTLLFGESAKMNASLDFRFIGCCPQQHTATIFLGTRSITLQHVIIYSDQAYASLAQLGLGYPFPSVIVSENTEFYPYPKHREPSPPPCVLHRRGGSVGMITKLNSHYTPYI